MIEPRPRGTPILVALAAAALLALAVFSHIRLRTEMADFLPTGGSEAARFMLRELRDGRATSLILVGIEGATEAELARISAGMADGLARSGLFALVSNGAPAADAADERFLFEHRYLLSPVTTPAAFGTPALRADLAALLRQLQSSAAPLVQLYGLADPPGAFLAPARAAIGGRTVRTVSGVWFAPHRSRALLLATTRAGGMDVGAQDAADAALHVAFDATRPGSARLLLAGPAVFTRDAAQGIRADVRRLSIVSTLLIVALLVWRFRNPWVIAAIAVPVIVSVSVAALVTQAVFGFVHGIALGFGMTMLGVTVDYPVLLIGHRKRGEAPVATIARIGPAFTLAFATAALGLTGMLFSGFPGLSQLGCFAAFGILAAALATRFLLPRLVVMADLAPVASGDPAALLRIERLRRGRLLGLAPILLAAGYLALVGGPRLELDLANLSPVPQADRDLDAELRGELGVPDVGQVIVIRGPNAETVLRTEEGLLPALDRLQAQGAIAGAEIAARVLPSVATQSARREALPPAGELAARMAVAQAGLGFREGAFQPFLDAVAAARTMPPIRPEDVASPLLKARLEPLLFARDGVWIGLVAPESVTEPAALAGIVAGLPDAAFVDMRGEANGLVATATAQAWRWLGLGAAAALATLAVGLREPLRVVRVAGSIAAAALVTVAALTAFGARLSLLHIVSLQFVAGVGIDYALFFARRQLDAEERARTLRTLVTCNAMTLLTFGLLAACRTPLLRDIGLTVVIGALAAMCFAFLFAGPRPRTP